MNQNTLLIDELGKGEFYYALCSQITGAPEFCIMDSGCFNSIEEIRAYQIEHKARVEIDASLCITGIQSAALHFKWTIVKPSQNAFPYIGFIVTVSRK